MKVPRYADLTKSHIARLRVLGIVLGTHMDAIQLRTVQKSADAIFHLENADWLSLAGLEIEYRPLFEQAIKSHWSEFEQMWNED